MTFDLSPSSFFRLFDLHHIISIREREGVKGTQRKKERDREIKSEDRRAKKRDKQATKLTKREKER